MKKLFLPILICCLTCLSGFSQIDEREKKLSIKELPTELINNVTAKSAGNLDCNCKSNLLKDPGFTNVTTYPGSSNISNTSSPWTAADYTPQYSSLNGACDKGFVLMWGNNTVGESITQNVALPVGTYTVKFNALYINTSGPHNPYVQLKIASGSSRSGTGLVTSSNISSTTWGSYTMTLTISSPTTSLCLYPVNGNTQNDGAYVSWIQLDNICIEKKDPCSDCPVPNTNVNFSICTTLGAGTTATVSAIGASTGLGNGWTLKQVSCPSANPCKWMPGGIKWQSTGSTITIPAGVLTPGCYVLTHYVNRCSKQWDPKQCVSYRSVCFTVCDNSITAAPDVNPSLMKKAQRAEVELDEVEKEAEVITGKN